jgi:hypothetical protein
MCGTVGQISNEYSALIVNRNALCMPLVGLVFGRTGDRRIALAIADALWDAGRHFSIAI